MNIERQVGGNAKYECRPPWYRRRWAVFWLSVGASFTGTFGLIMLFVWLLQ